MSANEFAATREMFASYVNYSGPLSYEDWLSMPDDYKTAVLYCQFYDTITLVWFKLMSYFVNDQDGVEEVLQYLDKNVIKIKEDPKRFNSSYIYKVVYNCLGCLCFGNRNKRMKGIADQEVYILDNTDDSIDESKNSYLACDGDIHAIDKDRQRKAIWNLVESKGHDAVVVVSELLGDSMDWTSVSGTNPEELKKFSKWDSKKITDERREEIISELRADLIKLYMIDEISSI